MGYLVVMLFWAGTIAGAFFYGQGIGKDSEVAAQARIGAAILQTRAEAQMGAAEAIAQLKPQYTTIRQETQREIQTNTFYRDCKLPAGGLRIANEALTGQRAAVPASGVKLPEADASGGRR